MEYKGKMLIDNQRLLAKSYNHISYPDDPPGYALLLQHSRDVAEACDALVEIAVKAALISAGLNAAYIERFATALKLNGWIQDLGKANSHFQTMVRGQFEITQLLRHEAISGLLLWLWHGSEDQHLRQWLSPVADEFIVSLWGAIGHHRKFDEQTAPEQSGKVTVYLTHPDFRAILQEMAESLALSRPPNFERDITIVRSRKEPGDVAALPVLAKMMSDFQDREGGFCEESVRRFLAIIKAFGIVADVVASAVPRHGRTATRSIRSFVREQLAIGLNVSDLTALIHHWAWNRPGYDAPLHYETKLPPNFNFRPFQNEVAHSLSYLTLAEAGCGSGKSLAAYLWARQWCQKKADEGFHNFRLFFCLPTTGTTTEHFRDYALESSVPASLAHSRSSIDLQTIIEAAQGEDAGSEDAVAGAQEVLKAERDRIEALSLWSTPLVVTTTDTVLGAMANSRRSIYTLPAILQGGVVFDEIHAFDSQLFGHLLVFLRNFPRLPVLLMTASLPEERLRALEKVRPDLIRVAGPEGFELLQRYEISIDQSDEDVWSYVERNVREGGKVLWVRNRVEWANQTYEEARRRFPATFVNVYHSRLRYKDRSYRHRRVIDRFNNIGQAAILVSTQVAEMSLDLSADLLVSDIATIPSLIQRLGRLNRRATPEKPGNAKPALICPLLPTNNAALPYTHDDLVIADHWIRLLMALGRPVSQRDLAEQFTKMAGEPDFNYEVAEENACFFGVPGKSGIWRTRPGLTRGDGYTISVILEQDIKMYREFKGLGDPSRDWLRNHEVAIPIRADVTKWERICGLRVAPESAIMYDYNEETREGTGARWQGN
jgi:CRISPR-associated endonuclease/helicase Cas3